MGQMYKMLAVGRQLYHSPLNIVSDWITKKSQKWCKNWQSVFSQWHSVLWFWLPQPHKTHRPFKSSVTLMNSQEMAAGIHCKDYFVHSVNLYWIILSEIKNNRKNKKPKTMTKSDRSLHSTHRINSNINSLWEYGILRLLFVLFDCRKQ